MIAPTPTTTRLADVTPEAPGRYERRGVLGVGGIGFVELAWDHHLGREVALKRLRPGLGGDAVRRFLKEARVGALLAHPGIVPVYELGRRADGALYYTMLRIRGRTLAQALDGADLADRLALLPHLIAVCQAVAYAHERGVVHRDLKPDNVMLTELAGRRDYVKVLDFGIAKVKKNDPGQQETVQTRAGLIVGSLRYISPEQVESREITPQTDLYSLGGILYEMLAGRRVFDYPSPADCAIAHLTEPPKAPNVDGVLLEGPLPDLIMQCLEKDPTKRPASAKVMLAMLDACANQPLLSSDVTLPHHVPSELPTVEEKDVHASATMASLSPPPAAAMSAAPSPSRAQAQTQAQSAPSPLERAQQALQRSEAATSSMAPVGDDVPLVQRPITRTGTSRPAVQALPKTTSTVTANALDCALDTPRKLMEVAPGATGIVDTALRPRVPTRQQGYEIVAGATGLRPRAEDIAQTPSQPGGVRLAVSQKPPSKTNPLVMALALIGLAAVGAAIYIFVIHPALTGKKAEQASAPPATVATEAPESSPAAPTTAPADKTAPTTAEGPSFTVKAPEPVPVDSVRVTTDVDGVAVFQNGSRIGTAPVLVTWGASEKPPELRLQKVGFNDELLQLTEESLGTEKAVKMTAATP
ncbi:MAG: protein kinase [Myxococcales bacterium]|nr:protein kinase [Myxococcales bacterium]